MLNELTTQQFFEIMAEFQVEICASCMLACVLGTLLFWSLSSFVDKALVKVITLINEHKSKERVINEKE